MYKRANENGGQFQTLFQKEARMHSEAWNPNHPIILAEAAVPLVCDISASTKVTKAREISQNQSIKPVRKSVITLLSIDVQSVPRQPIAST